MEKLNTLFLRLDHDNGLCDNENVVLLKLEYLVVCIIKKAYNQKKGTQPSHRYLQDEES